MQFAKGQDVYIVENGKYTRQCRIVEIRGGFAVLEFQNGALARLRLSRLFAKEEDAEAAILVHSQNAQEHIRNVRTPWE